MKYLFTVVLLLWCYSSVQAAPSEYALSDNQRIHSQSLGYDVQYRVLAPLDSNMLDAMDIVFITDGQNYLKDGNFDQLIITMIQQQQIKPIIAVFVDSRDPDNLSLNRRNKQFMCNKHYAGFYQNTLIPHLEQRYKLQHSANNRMIMGFSFGGLNAGCFGVLLPQTFGFFAMQSPASDKHVNVLAQLYQETPVSAAKMFISVGTRNDNTKAGRALHRQLLKQGYDINYHEVPYGHSWDNWRSTLELILLWFAPYQAQIQENGA